MLLSCEKYVKRTDHSRLLTFFFQSANIGETLASYPEDERASREDGSFTQEVCLCFLLSNSAVDHGFAMDF